MSPNTELQYTMTYKVIIQQIYLPLLFIDCVMPAKRNRKAAVL